MRIIGEIPHQELKITLFSWNSKYIVKIEAGPYEQTYKISETEVSGDEELKSLINEAFLNSVIENFKRMHEDWLSALKNV